MTSPLKLLPHDNVRVQNLRYLLESRIPMTHPETIEHIRECTTRVRDLLAALELVADAFCTLHNKSFRPNNSFCVVLRCVSVILNVPFESHFRELVNIRNVLVHHHALFSWPGYDSVSVQCQLIVSLLTSTTVAVDGKRVAESIPAHPAKRRLGLALLPSPCPSPPPHHPSFPHSRFPFEFKAQQPVQESPRSQVTYSTPSSIQAACVQPIQEVQEAASVPSAVAQPMQESAIVFTVGVCCRRLQPGVSLCSECGQAFAHFQKHWVCQCRRVHSLNEACIECGRTLLMHLVHVGGLATLESVVKPNEIDCNEVDCFGRTPLMLASMAGQVNLVHYLLNTMKANRDITDSCGNTALMYAKHHAVEQLLRESPSE